MSERVQYVLVGVVGIVVWPMLVIAAAIIWPVILRWESMRGPPMSTPAPP